MSRDLRYSTRDYTEPIIIITYDDDVVDYVVGKQINEPHEWYAAVMADRTNETSSNNSLVPNDGIKIKILKPTEFKIIPQQTIIEVRGIKYTVTQTDPVAIDNEYIYVNGKLSTSA